MRVLAATLPFAILLGSVVRTVVAQGHLKDSRISGHKDYDDISTLFDSIVQLKRALPSQDPDTSVPQDGPESLLGEGQRYNSSVATACRKTIESRESVANTLDIVACYNVPFFDVSSGKFVADIRLYQPSELRDFPAELNPSEYTLEVTIPQAALSEPRHITAENPKDDLSGFSMLYGLQHVGQLNPQIQLDKLSLEYIRILLLPNMTITTPNSEATIETTFSYLTGFFTSATPSDSPYTPSFPSPSSPPDPITLNFSTAASQLPTILDSATAFVLPGTTLAVFPLGLVITGVWSFLFFLIVGWGTLERWQSRRRYRNRVEMAKGRSFR